MTYVFVGKEAHKIIVLKFFYLSEDEVGSRISLNAQETIAWTLQKKKKIADFQWNWRTALDANLMHSYSCHSCISVRS